MKTRSLFLALLTLGILSWSCNKSEDSLSSLTPMQTASLKLTINTNVQELKSAVSTITSSAGYKLIVGDAALRGTTASALDTTSILLTNISGEYDYKATPFKRGFINLTRYFNRSADNALMIVRLPEEKVKNYGTLLMNRPGDDSLKNNYVVSVSDYNYTYSRSYGYDYKMASNINIKDVNAGDLKIQSAWRPKLGSYTYASEFAFANGYLTKVAYTTGDTAVSTYAISKDGKTLYEEKYTTIKTVGSARHKERDFSLTIGDVQIVRQLGVKTSLDSAKVYVAGVLQTSAKVAIVDVTNSSTTDVTESTVVNKKRELQITFDDGTTSTISQLAGTAITDISALFTSLRQAYFSTNVVDWVAWDVYWNKK